jgi:hypothetical protein
MFNQEKPSWIEWIDHKAYVVAKLFVFNKKFDPLTTAMILLLMVGCFVFGGFYLLSKAMFF